MKPTYDVLTVSFINDYNAYDGSLEDKAALCVTRKNGDQITVTKMELGEQADILYHLLTEQMTKVAIDHEETIIEADKESE